MTADYQKYYGCMFTLLIDAIAEGVSVRKLADSGAGFYVVNERVPILAKYSTSRTSPWSFTFQETHFRNYEDLLQKHGTCLIALICAMDGIATLRPDQVRSILSFDGGKASAISVKRKHNRMYEVSGNAAPLGSRISQNSLIELLREKV